MVRSKLDSYLLWEDDQVCLLIRRALSPCAAAPFAAAGGGAHLGRRGNDWGCSMSIHSGSGDSWRSHTSNKIMKLSKPHLVIYRASQLEELAATAHRPLLRKIR